MRVSLVLWDGGGIVDISLKVVVLVLVSPSWVFLHVWQFILNNIKSML